jgi:tetratricopeptide (TPR) repeat protein
MGDSRPAEKFFLKIALKNELLTRQQIHKLLQLSQTTGRSVAELALSRGMLGDDQVDRIQRTLAGSQVARIDQLYAQTLRQRRLVADVHLKQALKIQKKRAFEVRLGELLVTAGLISLETHAHILKDVLGGLENKLRAPVPRTGSASKTGLGSRPPLASARRLGRPSGATKAQPVLELKGDSVRQGSLKSSQSKAKKASKAPKKQGFERKTRLDAGYKPGVGLTDETASVAYSSSSKSQASNDKQFVVSAIDIELEDDEDALTEHDRAMIEDDVKTVQSMSRSGLTTFDKLDGIQLSTSMDPDALAFQPDEYFLKRRRTDFKRKFFGAIVGALVLAIVSAVLVAWNNSSALASLKTRVLAVRRDSSLNKAFNDLKGIKRDFESLGHFGLSAPEKQKFESFLRGMILQSEIHSLLAEEKDSQAENALRQGRVQRARELRRGSPEEQVGLSVKLLKKLRDKINFARAWRDALAFQSERRYGLAIRCYLRAHDDAPVDDNRAEQRVKKIEANLLSRVLKLQKRAQVGDVSSIAEWQEARKNFYQIFQRLPESTADKQSRNVDAQDLIQLAQNHAKARMLEKALGVLLDARALKKSFEIDTQISIIRRKIKAVRWLKDATLLVKKQKYLLAYPLLLRVRPVLLEEAQIQKVDKMIEVCRESLP